MILIPFAIFTAFLHLTGAYLFPILITTAPAEPLSVRAGYAGILGAGFVCAVTLYTQLFGIPLSREVVIAAALLLLFLSFLRRRRQCIIPVQPSDAPVEPSLTWYELLLLLAILLQAGQILFTALWWPVSLQDDWAQWSANGRFLFHYGRFDATYFHNLNLSSYPILLMSNSAFVCAVRGGWDDFLCNILPSILVLDTALVLFGRWRLMSNRPFALATVFVFLFLPLVSRVGRDGTADLPLTLLLGLAAFECARALASSSPRSLLLPGLLLALVASTKSEGFVDALLFAFLALAFLWRASLLRPAAFASLFLPLLILSAPWQWLLFRGGCPATRFHEFSFENLYAASSLGEVLTVFAQHLAPSKDTLYLLGPYLVLAFAYWLLRHRADRASCFYLLLLLALTVFYYFASYGTGWHDVYPRLLTHTALLALFFISRQAGRALGLLQPEDSHD